VSQPLEPEYAIKTLVELVKEQMQTHRFDMIRELLKAIAVITMTIDHVGAIFYPDTVLLRIVGRLSFPTFSYLLVLGTESTRNPRNYVLRLLFFAVISQIPYSLAFGFGPFEQLNIFFALSLGVLSIILYKRRSLLILLPVLAAFLNVEGNVYGIAVIIIMAVLKEDRRIGVLAFLFINVLFLPENYVQTFSLLALPIILLHDSGLLKVEMEISENSVFPSMKKYFFYVYYPLHLTLFYLIKSNFFQFTIPHI